MPAFSPDGAWLAYVSDESGRSEVYVQPFPGPGAKYPVSTDGGTEPVWAPGGRELFLRNGDEMLVVEISSQPTFSATLSLVNIRPLVKSTTYGPGRLSSGPKKAKLRGHGTCSHVRRLVRSSCGAGTVSEPGRPGDRKPRAEAAGDGAEAGAATPTPRRCRPRVLGRTSTIVVWVDDSPAHRQPGYRGPVAPGSVPAILGEDLPGPTAGATSRRWGNPAPHPANGATRLEGTAYSRRAEEARLQRRRDRVALFAAESH